MLPPVVDRDPPHRSLFGRLPCSTVIPPPSQGSYMVGAIQLAQQTVSEAYERDRNALRSKINKIEVVRKKLTEFFERNIQDVASQCAKNDSKE